MNENDNFNIQRKNRKMFSIFLAKRDKTIPDTKGDLEWWKEYTQELFDDEMQQEIISNEEIIQAIILSASGLEETPADLFKLINENKYKWL